MTQDTPSPSKKVPSPDVIKANECLNVSTDTIRDTFESGRYPYDK